MKTLRVILVGVLLWILIFVEISITMVGLKLSDSAVWIIHYLFLIPIGILCARIYYKSHDKLNGFLLGFILLVVGTILDAVITVPIFIIPQGGSYAAFFSDWTMLIGGLELIVVTGLYDFLRGK